MNNRPLVLKPEFAHTPADDKPGAYAELFWQAVGTEAKFHKPLSSAVDVATGDEVPGGVFIESLSYIEMLTIKAIAQPKGWTACSWETDGREGWCFQPPKAAVYMPKPFEVRSTKLPSPVSGETSALELFREALPGALSVWRVEGNTATADVADVASLDFNDRESVFGMQRDILEANGWRDISRTDGLSQITEYRYSKPRIQYRPANIWEALTLLGGPGWFDEQHCEVSGNTVTWGRDIDPPAYGRAARLEREAAEQPCFTVAANHYQGHLSISFNPGRAFNG